MRQRHTEIDYCGVKLQVYFSAEKENHYDGRKYWQANIDAVYVGTDDQDIYEMLTRAQIETLEEALVSEFLEKGEMCYV